MKTREVGFALILSIAIGFSGGMASAASPSEQVQTGVSASEEGVFTNDDVVTMVQAGFAKETIVEAIRSSQPGFDTSVEALIALKNAGVSEDIIVEILAATRGGAALQPGEGGVAEGDGLPSDDGVYALKDGVYVPLPDERIEWRSGFFSGTTTVMGRTTTKLNARLRALNSPLELSGPPDLLLVCEDCESAFDYHLVLANDDKDKREFQISFQVLPGRYESYKALGGTGKEKIEFEAETLAEGKYILLLPALESGEYGILPFFHGDHPESVANSVLYTFRLVSR